MRFIRLILKYLHHIWEMLSPEKVKIIKGLIDEGRLESFRDIFMYIYKSEVAKELGINYTRFRLLTESPKDFRYSEIYAIAKKLKVAPRALSQLIHNQIEEQKPTGTTKK